MNIQGYKKIDNGKRKKLKKKITAIVLIGIIVIVALSLIGILAGDSQGYIERVSILEENHMLNQKVAELETKSATLEARVRELEEYISMIAPSEQEQPYDIRYENGLYYYNEESQSDNPDSPRDNVEN